MNVITLSKFGISLLACLHLGYLFSGLFLGHLGGNPVEVITHDTGEWGLHFLLLSLSITPLRRHFHWNQLLKLRRFLGLWSFAYLLLHGFTFILFDHVFFWPSIWEDIVERPYITVGVAGLLLMVPLAMTSFQRLQKRLGKRWLLLHRSVYMVAILGVLHYWWLVKADILQPLVYFIVLVLLLLDRVYWVVKKNTHRP